MKNTFRFSLRRHEKRKGTGMETTVDALVGVGGGGWGTQQQRQQQQGKSIKSRRRKACWSSSSSTLARLMYLNGIPKKASAKSFST
jgi:hypothetical protein